MSGLIETVEATFEEIANAVKEAEAERAALAARLADAEGGPNPPDGWAAVRVLKDTDGYPVLLLEPSWEHSYGDEAREFNACDVCGVEIAAPANTFDVAEFRWDDDYGKAAFEETLKRVCSLACAEKMARDNGVQLGEPQATGEGAGEGAGDG